MFIILSHMLVSSSILHAETNLVMKNSKKLATGQLFDLPEIKEKCHQIVDCQKAGKDFCESGKSKVHHCSEQYRHAWITTCICLEK